MSRRARLTVLELGASATAWASCHALGADDWVVVAQQSDEKAAAFAQRVQHRAERLRKEDAQIDSVDLYTAPRADRVRSAARQAVIGALSDRIAQGGRLTLWSSRNGEADLAAILAQFEPLLAKRQIAVNHQTCDADERSGVRHAVPTREPGADSEFDDFPLTQTSSR